MQLWRYEVVSFTLPADVSFTSDSGVFLTRQSPDAPEPGSMALLAAGAAALALVGRKYRLSPPE